MNFLADKMMILGGFSFWSKKKGVFMFLKTRQLILEKSELPTKKCFNMDLIDTTLRFY